MSRSPPRLAPSTAQARAAAMQRVALIAILTNTVLTVGQIVVGLFANAFSLVADATHTLSDLITDIMVLAAARGGAEPADKNHPYGHGRIETAASLALGLILAGVGLGFLWSSGIRLQNIGALPELHGAALAMALFTLAAKEVLFRFTLRAARRLRAPVLEANAWHARSDAASSLVVAAGIGGSLAGYPFLEPLAAAVVGFLILHMGARLAWRAIRELIDTGLPEEELARLRATIEQTPGVAGLHDLRTRRMADRVLCDAHVRVDPRITVSEGHHISDAVYFRVRAAHPEVQEVLVHIDSEDDGVLHIVPPGPLPDRAEVLKLVQETLAPDAPAPQRVQIHFLGDRLEVEVLLPSVGGVDPDALKRRVQALTDGNPAYRSMSFYVRIAP
ncbi:cation diffusion facilitator family transporter [Pseudothauera rhizosphaerae]|uniref:Cation transporter n=1 Tax=Pseudothauera rhizosphaerae TaxID=2565932 RepID=A0A4S4APR7_9RHOO|nr:cation diffusion facilitator family transporter [Pseudothauera rhizosphaerae]THF61248.1 cation transporter [Pseudothauera rhizosphaerae]